MQQRREHRQGRFVWLLDDTDRTAWIKKGHIGRCRTYHVPDHVVIEGVKYTVTSIEICAFNSPRTLKHLVIPDSITYVDEDVFCCLPNLRSACIGKGVEYMNNWQFRGCPKLQTVTIAKGNPHLKVRDGLLLSGDGTVLLRGLCRHRHLIIPEGVKYIEKVAFWYDRDIEYISFPSTLKEMSDECFASLTGIKRVTLPEGLTRMIVQNFMDCTALEYIDLPSTLSDFGRENFLGCKSLNTIILRANQVLTCDDSDIDGIPRTCHIQVPAGLIPDYRKHPAWGKFENIEPIANKPLKA